MTELEYDIIIPIKIQCASPAHAEVLTAWIAKDVSYNERGDPDGSPMGAYEVTSGEARVVRSGGHLSLEVLARLNPKAHKEAFGLVPGDGRTVVGDAVDPEDTLKFAASATTLVFTDPDPADPSVQYAAEVDAEVIAHVPVQPTQEPPAPEPPAAPEKERRRRTKTWPGTDVVTAGITPATCDALVAAIATPEAQALATATLSRFTQPVFGVLREEEGQALLEQIRALVPTPVAPEAPALAEEAPVKPDGPSEGDTVYTRFGAGTVESVAADTLIVKVTDGRSMNFYRREISLTPIPVVPPVLLPGQIKCAVSGEPKDPAYCKPDACTDPVACRAEAHPAPVGTPVVPPWLRGGKA
jgi:hypothetical protein